MIDTVPLRTALQARAIGKRFGSIRANDGVSIALQYGRIHALLGENGAGKSTLLSVLYGLLTPDEGSVSVDGETVQIRRPGDAIRCGVGLVQQHFSLIPAFTVLENILLGRERLFIDERGAERSVRERLQPYGLDLPLRVRVGNLPVGVQQQVEIAKVLFWRARIVLFDEPTAALVSNEIEAFHDILHHLRERGIAVALITHRLPEVMRSADDVTVLRKGRVVLQKQLCDSSAEEIAEAIVGERLPEERYDLPEPGAPVLKASALCFASSTKPLDFEVREREILGVAGVAGNGQEETIDGLLGIEKTKSGSLVLMDEEIGSCCLAERKRKGLSYIPQDRIGRAMLPHQSVFENYQLNRGSLPGGDRWFPPRREISQRIASCIDEFQIQIPSQKTEARFLSGGHQQRLVISRELMSRPKLIVAQNPTRGLDLRAARFVNERLYERCCEGAGVILFSPEWSNLFLLCKRIAVLYRGALVDVRDANQWTARELGRRMVGMEANGAQ